MSKAKEEGNSSPPQDPSSDVVPPALPAVLPENKEQSRKRWRHNLLVAHAEKSGLAQNPRMEQQTLLHLAAAAGEVETVKKILESGVAVNVQDDEGATALYVASAAGHKEIVKLLLEHGADVRAQNDSDVTALHRAVIRGHRGIVQMLLDHKADVCERDIMSRHSALGRALSQSPSPSSIRTTLLEHITNLHASSVKNDGSADVAAQQGQSKAAEEPVAKRSKTEDGEKSGPDEEYRAAFGPGAGPR